MHLMMKVIAVHGDRDKAAAHKRHEERQIRENVPEDKRTPGPEKTAATAVLQAEDGSTMELMISDWDEAAALEQGMVCDVTVAYTKV